MSRRLSLAVRLVALLGMAGGLSGCAVYGAPGYGYGYGYGYGAPGYYYRPAPYYRSYGAWNYGRPYRRGWGHGYGRPYGGFYGRPYW